jgi:hypothetical protein
MRAIMSTHGPHADSDRDVVTDLTLEIRPAYRRLRWEWCLVDRRDGSVAEHSLEYDSPSTARRAGIARLAELTARQAARAGTPTRDARPRKYLVIVSRRTPGFYAQMKGLFAQSESVEVILDRRRSPRSVADAAIHPSGWWIARASDAPPREDALRKSA